MRILTVVDYDDMWPTLLEFPIVGTSQKVETSAVITSMLSPPGMFK